MAVKTMEEKFTLAISKTYDAEHQFLDGQREMLQHANNPQLKEMLDGHIRTTEQQIGRLEQIFDQLGQKPKRVTCEAASGLIADGRSEIKEVSGNPKLVDIVIADAQAKVEHSEIATYRGLVMGAEAMGQQDVLRLLRESLREEEQTAQMVESRTPQLLQEAMQKSREAGA